MALYHISTEGYNPLKWRMRPSKDLHDPLSVAERNPRLRRGNLTWENNDDNFNTKNTKKLGKWLWIWLK
jgi:hypothetical protein